MSDKTTPISSATDNAQFLAPETHQRAVGGAGEGDQGQQEETNYGGMTGTYSPDDNKLRLYSALRLDPDLYKRVRGAGFIWAPKQELFVAPAWTPERADLLMEVCGDIGDEDTSLVHRAEERAERFGDYKDNRTQDANAAHRAVDEVSKRFEFGQPILVGHHSERKARKDAERMESGMRRAVKMWDTANYWEQRAKGALQHAKYKERADVRARRIKGIEADKRKQERNKAEAAQWLKLWSLEALTLEQARVIANRCWLTVTQEGSVSGGWTAYDVLRPDGERYAACPSWTVGQVQEVARRVYPLTIARCERWIAHYDNRIAYERAMLDEQGGIAATKTGPEVGGGAKCWASPNGGWSFIKKVNKVSVTVEDNWGNGGKNFTRTIPFDKLSQLMTRSQVEEARAAGQLKEADDLTGFFLMRTRERFDSDEAKAGTPNVPPVQADLAEPAGAKFDTLRAQLREGVKVETVHAPQLFRTPAALAARMVDMAGIRRGHRVLEPSAGTGRLLRAIREATGGGATRTAVEINTRLCDHLRIGEAGAEVVPGDFLQCGAELGAFDRVVMNPPFADAADIKHILHAYRMVKPGGLLVAICANGPRQNQILRALVDERGGAWEDLPADTFKDEGTGVRAALITIPA